MPKESEAPRPRIVKEVKKFEKPTPENSTFVYSTKNAEGKIEKRNEKKQKSIEDKNEKLNKEKDLHRSIMAAYNEDVNRRPRAK